MDMSHPHPTGPDSDPERPPATLWHSLAAETRVRLLVLFAAVLVLANPVVAAAIWAYSDHRMYLAVIQAVLTGATAIAACDAANRLTHDDGGLAASGIVACFALIEIIAFIVLQLFALVN